MSRWGGRRSGARWWVAVPAWLGLVMPGHAVDSPQSPDFSDCGTLALATLLQVEGQPVRPDRVAACLPARDDHTMAELIAAARQLGLNLQGVQLDRADWPIDRPIIAHLNRAGVGHFVVVRSVGHSGHLPQTIDPVGGARVVEADDLFAPSQWTGAVLMPARVGDGPFFRPGVVAGVLAASGACLLLARRRDSRSRKIRPAASGS